MVKKVSQKMSSPTVGAVQRLRKVIGYLRNTGDFAGALEKPIAGHGRCKSTGEKVWILESFSDADWSSNRVHRLSTSCGIHLLNGQVVYGSSRSVSYHFLHVSLNCTALFQHFVMESISRDALSLLWELQSNMCC